MKKLFSFIILVGLLFVGCSSNNKKSLDEIKQDQAICPQCNMPLSSDSNDFTAYAIVDNHTIYFDDIGCMVLYLQEHNINLQNIDTKVFTIDTKKYIDGKKCYYKMDHKTPMHYGFVCYEKQVEGNLAIKDMQLKILRGETMINPKIRKQILGY